jgi:O-antigen ligase
MLKFHKFRTLTKDILHAGAEDTPDSIALVVLLIFVGTVPLFYAGSSASDRPAMGGGVVLPGGTLILELTAFLLFMLVCLSKTPALAIRPLAIPALCVTLLLVLGLLQLLPLPEGLLSRVSPASLTSYHETSELLGLFGRHPRLAARISIAPTETVGVVLLVLAYAALFFSAATLLRGRPRRRIFVGVLLTTAVTQTLVAAVREKPGDRLHGAFVNPDHLAGYLEIALAIAFGVVWARALMGSDRVRKTAGRSEKFEHWFVPMAGRSVLWGLIAVGVGLTRSRGGILAAATTTAVLLGMAILQRPIRYHGRAAAAGALAILAGAFFALTMLGSGPFRRFLQLDPRGLSSDDRVIIWRASLKAWREFPIFGSGLGTFREAFRRAQPRGFPGLIEQAHSDSLQLLVTGGTIGAALGILACASLFILLARAWRRQKHREESALTLAGFGALLSLTLHGLVDFNLSVPAITATLACAIGAAWAAATEK